MVQLAASRCATGLYCGTGGYNVVVAVLRVAVVHFAPRVEAAAAVAVLTVIVVVPILLFLMDHRGFGVTCVRFAVRGQKAGTADPESPGAATEFPCCLIPCDNFFVSAVVAAACDFFFCALAWVRSGDAACWKTCCCCCLVLRVAAVVADVAVAGVVVAVLVVVFCCDLLLLLLVVGCCLLVIGCWLNVFLF